MFLRSNQYFPVKNGKGYNLTLCLEPIHAVDFFYHQVPIIPLDVPHTLHFSSVQYKFFKGDYVSIDNELSVI